MYPNYQNYLQQYQQPQQQMYSQQQANQQQNNISNMTYVQGESGAKSYLLAPNTTMALWDSEAQTIYVKTSDASGIPSMKILDYTIRDNVPQKTNFAPTSDFITKEDISTIEDRLNALEGKLERISHNKKNNHKKGGLNNEQSNTDD